MPPVLNVSFTELAGRRKQQMFAQELWLGMHEQDATISAFDLVVREQRVQGSFAYTNPEFGRALGLLESGLINPGVSRKSFPLEESGDVFRKLLQGSSDGFLKAIVCPC